MQPNTSLEALWSIWSHFVAKTAAASFLLPVIAAAFFSEVYLYESTAELRTTLVDLFWAHQKQVTLAISWCIRVAPSGCIGGWPYAHVLELELSNCSYAWKLKTSSSVLQQTWSSESRQMSTKTFCGETWDSKVLWLGEESAKAFGRGKQNPQRWQTESNAPQLKITFLQCLCSWSDLTQAWIFSL